MGFGTDVFDSFACTLDPFPPAWLPCPTLYEGLFKVFMVSCYTMFG